MVFVLLFGHSCKKKVHERQIFVDHVRFVNKIHWGDQTRKQAKQKASRSYLVVIAPTASPILSEA